MKSLLIFKYKHRAAAQPYEIYCIILQFKQEMTAKCNRILLLVQGRPFGSSTCSVERRRLNMGNAFNLSRD
jgi:hypothetical protein